MNWTQEKVEHYLRVVREDLATGRITSQMLQMDEIIASCGTVACIGGWMKLRRHEAEKDYVGRHRTSLGEISDGLSDERSEGLDALFYSFPGNVTPERAVQAIDQWLEGSNDPWERYT